MTKEEKKDKDYDVTLNSEQTFDAFSTKQYADIVLIMQGIKNDEDETYHFRLNTHDRHNDNNPISSEDAFRMWLSLSNILADHPSFADMTGWQKQMLTMAEKFMAWQIQKDEELESTTKQ